MDNAREVIEWYFWSNLIYCIACMLALAIDTILFGAAVSAFGKARDSGEKYDSGMIEAIIVLLWPTLVFGCFYFAVQATKAKVAPSLISVSAKELGSHLPRA